MSHRPRPLIIAFRKSQASLPFGGGLIVNPESGNPVDNTSDGLLVIDTAKTSFLLVDDDGS